ncbi:hypothetical protein GCM10009678_82520 [Actinomadura kijaniata]
MTPSPEAAEWGKRQASQSPTWSDAKWQRVARIFQAALADAQDDQAADEQPAETRRDAA